MACTCWQVRVLTHCNTGSLATAGYGTALGVIRALHEAGKLEHAYCTETRPYNQGTCQKLLSGIGLVGHGPGWRASACQSRTLEAVGEPEGTSA